MHTKKTNNTNKLIQISYHSILTKIQKLQNLKKKKKKKLFSVPAGTPGTGRYCPKLAGTRPVRPVFFPVQNRGVERTGLLASTVYSGRTSWYGTELTTLGWTSLISKIFPHWRVHSCKYVFNLTLLLILFFPTLYICSVHCICSWIYVWFYSLSIKSCSYFFFYHVHMLNLIFSSWLTCLSLRFDSSLNFEICNKLLKTFFKEKKKNKKKGMAHLEFGSLPFSSILKPINDTCKDTIQGLQREHVKYNFYLS